MHSGEYDEKATKNKLRILIVDCSHQDALNRIKTLEAVRGMLRKWGDSKSEQYLCQNERDCMTDTVRLHDSSFRSFYEVDIVLFDIDCENDVAMQATMQSQPETLVAECKKFFVEQQKLQGETPCTAIFVSDEKEMDTLKGARARDVGDVKTCADLPGILAPLLRKKIEAAQKQRVQQVQLAQQKANDDQKALVDRFRKIYTVMRNSETAWYSYFYQTDMLSELDQRQGDFAQLEFIKSYCKDYPNSRSAKAFQLVQEQDESVVIRELYLHSFKNSGVFTKSNATGLTFWKKDKLEQHLKENPNALKEQDAKADSRLGKIIQAIRKP